MTEKDGKATGWKAFYHGGKWQEERSAGRKKKA
jgi:DNA topoisomerase-1